MLTLLWLCGGFEIVLRFAPPKRNLSGIVSKVLVFLSKLFPMALTTVNIKTTFDYSTSPKKFTFQDISDYAGQGIALTDVVGVIKIVAPSGMTVYNNTNFNSPDINPDVSLINSTTINLPLDSNNVPLQGDYTITYTVRVNPTSLVASYDVAVEKETTHTYSSPVVSLDISANLVLPSMTSTDNTSYTKTNSLGSPVTPTIVRAHTLFYPPTTGAAAITGTGASLSTSVVYGLSGSSLQYSSSLTSDLTYNFGSDFYVVDEVKGTDRFNLDIDENLCNIYCGINNLFNNWQTYKGTTRGDEYFAKFQQVTALGLAAQVAIDCGETQDVNGYFEQMRKIGGFTADCECGDGTPTLLTGLGGSGTVVVQAGSGIEVATSTSGTTTYYTVSIATATLTKINNSYNSTVAAGAGISVATVTDANGNKTYTVTNTATAPSTVAQQFTITFSSGSLPTITSNNSIVYGTKTQTATIANDFNGSVPSWQGNLNSFTLSSFLTGSHNYYPSIEIVQRNQTGSSLSKRVQLKPRNFIIYQKDATTFNIQIVDDFGNPVTGSNLDSTYDSIVFNIKITA